MSYILEALKKSEAERRLGDVPDLNTPPLPKRTVEKSARPRASRRYLLGALFLLLVVNLGITTWLLFDRAPADEQQGVAVVGSGAAPLRNPSPPVSRAPAPRVEAAPTGVVPSPAPPPRLPEVVLRPKRLSESPVAEPTPAPVAKVEPRPAPEPAPLPDRMAGSGDEKRLPVDDGADRVPVWDELPLSVRTAFHRPHVDVHVYDPDPDRRFVRLDLQKYREGDRTPEGLRVERITREGVVLSWHGNRFLLARP